MNIISKCSTKKACNKKQMWSNGPCRLLATMSVGWKFFSITGSQGVAGVPNRLCLHPHLSSLQVRSCWLYCNRRYTQMWVSRASRVGQRQLELGLMEPVTCVVPRTCKNPEFQYIIRSVPVEHLRIFRNSSARALDLDRWIRCRKELAC